MNYGWLLSADFHVIAGKLFQLKQSCEIAVIEALICQPDKRLDADAMGLRLSSFAEDDLRMMYLMLPHVADMDEHARIEFLARGMRFIGHFDDSMPRVSRSGLWSVASLVSAGRSWPRGSHSLACTVPKLLEVNRRVEVAQRSYGECLSALEGAA